MKYQVTTAPTTEPVTLAEALKHCRITDQSDNDYVLSLITRARDVVERAQNCALCTQTITGYLDAFPDDRAIELERPPVLSVTSVTYVDTAGTSRTFSGYHVDTVSHPARIVLNADTEWPDTQDRANAVTIVYQAGYTAETLPPAYKHALLLLIGHFFEHREPAVTGTIITQVPMSVQYLLDSVAWDLYR